MIEQTEASNPAKSTMYKAMKFIGEFIIYGCLFIAISYYINIWAALGIFAGLAFYKK